jgi:UDP-arabinose 4-epimerase
LKNVLVTGGAGYIGSHACKALAQAGYTPVSYDNLVYGHDWAVRWGPLEQGEIADRVRLDEVIRRYRPRTVMHFAAYAYVGESVENPGKYYRNNVAGTLALIEAMRDHGVDKLLFSSTCATYGVPRAGDSGRSPSGASIHAVPPSSWSAHAAGLPRAHGIRSVALRYFNAAGADPEREIGEGHAPGRT